MFLDRMVLGGMGQIDGGPAAIIEGVRAGRTRGIFLSFKSLRSGGIKDCD